MAITCDFATTLRLQEIEQPAENVFCKLDQLQEPKSFVIIAVNADDFVKKIHATSEVCKYISDHMATSEDKLNPETFNNVGKIADLENYRRGRRFMLGNRNRCCPHPDQHRAR
uniref:T-complex protein 1 subunit alpha n=1 Tax=Culex pipiens TaxID=7175 RepID=A0A8D8NTY3_CULPI